MAQKSREEGDLAFCSYPLFISVGERAASASTKLAKTHGLITSDNPDPANLFADDDVFFYSSQCPASTLKRSLCKRDPIKPRDMTRFLSPSSQTVSLISCLPSMAS